ncbi:MAG: hypothetical protein WBA53_03810, partial [Burkholderiaceae bacterium]
MLSACALALSAAGPAAASSVVVGESFTFRSAGGVEERCIVLARMPGAAYRDSDVEEERAFCEINFDAGTHALCPKLFSTSPGTLIHDLRGGTFANDPARFERAICPRGQIIT